MMIDFSKIVELVPDGGRLILTFTAKAGKNQNGDEGTKEMSIVFAQQFAGKENDNDFSPIIITGGIAELSESFGSTVTDIARDQKKLAELKTTTTGRIDQKKEEEQKEEKKVEAKNEKPKPVMADLFSMSPAKPTEPETAPAVPPASEPDTGAPDANKGVDHE